MSSHDAFLTAYKALNASQKEAVDTIEGPVMVIAGPGTGKTQVLTLRIANILLKTDTPPDGVLALTFTEAAAGELRARLLGLIGVSAYRVRIHTFHGFAESVIRDHPSAFPRIIGGTLAGDVEGVEILRTIIDKTPSGTLKPFGDPYFYVNSLRRFIQDLKREGYTPERFKTFLDEETARVRSAEDFIHQKGAHKGKVKSVYTQALARIEKHKEAIVIYEAYEEALKKARLYDFEDMIGSVVSALRENEDLLRELQERFLYLLADEHQDANASQNRLLELLSSFHDAPNIFIVGDEKQAIYRFQGAALDTFLSLKERCPDTKIILLSENYRSCAPILTTAGALIAPAPIPDQSLRVPLLSKKGSGSPVRVCAYMSEEDEKKGICKFIEEKVRTGAAHTDIALLVRRNTDAVALAQVLKSEGIPYALFSEQHALSHPIASLFRSVVLATVEFGRESALARALFAPGNTIPREEVTKLLLGRRHNESLISLMGEEARLREIGVQDPSEIMLFKKTLERLSEETPSLSLHGALSRVLSDTGFLSGVIALPDDGEGYRVMEGLFLEAKALEAQNPSATLRDFLSRLTLIESHKLSLSRTGGAGKGVRIMTAHRAKGLEFPYVVIAHANDTRWGKEQADAFSLVPTAPSDEHDARRLLYVALTRGKEEVLITYAKISDTGRATLPSRFLADIEDTVTKEQEEETEVSRTILSKAPPAQPLLRSVDFLRERFLSQGLSVTALNNFITSPWQFLFRNLLRIPDERNQALIFGDAVHAGLRDYFDEIFHGNEGSVADAEKTFIGTLERNAHVGIDVPGLIPRGQEALRAYLKEHGTPASPVGHTEFPLEVSLDIPGVGVLPIRGKLDRIDILSGNKAVVIDYKTGKSKSEREIRGETSAGDGGYFRQLAFYGFLLRADGRWAIDTARLDFVEPNDSGKIVSRAFPITKDDIDTVSAEIVSVAQKIYSFDFLNDPCDPATSDYCDLVAQPRF